MAQARSNLLPQDNQSFDLSRRQPGLGNEIAANWRLGWGPQAWGRINAEAHQPDDQFDPWGDLDGYEDYADALVYARSRDEQLALKRMVDQNRRDQNLLANGEWGLLAGAIAGIADPANLIPIPAAQGLGIVKGAARLGGIFGATAIATETVRINSDPTASGEEMIYNVGLGTLLGAAIGAPVGAWGSKSRGAMRAFERELASVDSPNWSLRPRGADENIRFEFGARPMKGADGTRSFFSLGDELGGYVMKKAGNGENFVYEPDEARWIYAADRDRPDMRIVPEEIADELGAPERTVERVMRIDEAGLKNRYRQGKWQDEIVDLLDDEALPVEQVVRSEADYVNFRTVREMWERADPRKADETVEVWRDRTGKAALKEYQAGRVDMDYARVSGLEGVLERLNFSPVAHAIRSMPGDNRVADLALRLGGDHGWMIQQNQYGNRTPPSVLLKAMRHSARWTQFRAEFDQQWLRFVSGQKDAVGKIAQSYNLSAAAWAMRQGGRRLMGRNVLTYDDFAKMTAKAVYTKGEFQVNGHPVNEFARKAAESYNRMMQEYDALAREAGVFKDQQAIDRDIADWQRRRRNSMDGALRWLWGKEGEPKAQTRAIRTSDGRVWTGEDYDQIVSDIIDELGDDGFRLTEELTDDSFGYTARQAKVEPQGARVIEHWTDDTGFDSAYEGFTRLGEALDHAVMMSNDAGYRMLVRSIYNEVQDVKIQVVHRMDADAAVAAGLDDPMVTGLEKSIALYGYDDHRITLRGSGFDQAGTTPEVVIHEAIHASVSRRLFRGIREAEAGLDTPAAQAANRLADMWHDVKTFIDDIRANEGDKFDAVVRAIGLEGNLDAQQEFWGQLKYLGSDIQELPTVGLTNPHVRALLQSIPVDGGLTMWDRFVDVLRGLMGWSRKQITEYDRLLDVVQSLQKTAFPEGQMWWDFQSAAVSGAENVSRETSRFRTIDELMEARAASMSESQRAIYDERMASVRKADEMIESLRKDRENAKGAHGLVDAAGNAENYYTRYFDNSAISTNREAFTRLIEKWYERDNPNGARARAEETVDHIVSGQVDETGALGGARALNSRALSMPTSWSIVDGELGEIAVSDFIENNILAVSEQYVKRMGVSIEMAKMFGDTTLDKEKASLLEYLQERYLTDDMDAAARAAGREKINETMGWVDIIARSMNGQLKTADPWRWDNRTSRLARNLTTLSVMGKVMLTAVPELFRAPMTQGFGNAFRSVFMRYLGDLEKMRPNLEFMRLSGEIDDLARTRANARVVSMENGSLASGGTWFEREIEARIPGFFKLVGLTSWTVWAKEWTMLAAQHQVMTEARQIAGTIRSGGSPSARDVARLAALGINQRDVLLLADMPVENHGSILLPAVDNWQGAAGRKAREALLTAIHAEARRAIVTPSIGDKSTVFNGVWTDKGKVKFESDMMLLPMQFIGYGMAASNKILTSALQQRDRSAIGGMFFMILGGIMSQYLKLNENAWRNKTYDEIILSGIESAGIGGFWFGDMNNQIERFSGNTVGLRPLLGMDPKFGANTEMDGMIDIAGAAPSHIFDISRAFWDQDLSASQRAQLIRRGVPYNNVLWWSRIFRDMAGTAGEAFEGSTDGRQ